MHEPDIDHYPVWLRELIFPTELINCRAGTQDHMEFEKLLRRVFDQRRKDPVCAVLSETTLETIRYRFRLYAHQNRISEQDHNIRTLTTQVEELTVKLEKLEKKSKKKKKV